MPSLPLFSAGLCNRPQMEHLRVPEPSLLQVVFKIHSAEYPPVLVIFFFYSSPSLHDGSYIFSSLSFLLLSLKTHASSVPVSIAIGTGVNSNDYSTFFTFLPPKGLLLNFMTVIMMLWSKGILTPLIPDCYVLCTLAILKNIRNPLIFP